MAGLCEFGSVRTDDLCRAISRDRREVLVAGSRCPRATSSAVVPGRQRAVLHPRPQPLRGRAGCHRTLIRIRKPRRRSAVLPRRAATDAKAIRRAARWQVPVANHRRCRVVQCADQSGDSGRPELVYRPVRRPRQVRLAMTSRTHFGANGRRPPRCELFRCGNAAALAPTRR
jgi:hypothetical protein